MGMDDQGVLYFGTSESGLVRYVNGKFEKLFVPNALHYGQYGRIVPAPDGKLIFAQLYASGADQFDPASNTWTKVPSEQDIPRAFDAKGQMWSGSGDGVWIFGADENTHITKEQGLPSNEVYGIVFGKDGTAYIATGAGVAVFDGKKITATYTKAKNGLISDMIYTLFMASDGSLWVGEEVVSAATCPMEAGSITRLRAFLATAPASIFWLLWKMVLAISGCQRMGMVYICFPKRASPPVSFPLIGCGSALQLFECGGAGCGWRTLAWHR